MSLLDDVSIVVTPNGYKAGELYAVIPVPTEGANVVINGDFSNGTTDWTPNAAATLSIDTGRLKIAISGAGSGYAHQTFTIESGKQYKCTGTIDFGTASQMRFYVSNTGQFFDITQSGNFDFTFTSTGTSTQVRLYTYGDGNYGFWDNVSVKVYVSADMDVTRATAATRVDENGLVNYAEVIGDSALTGNNSNFDTGIGSWVGYNGGTLAHSTDKLEVTLLSSQSGARIDTNSLISGGQAGKTFKVRARIWQGTTTDTSIFVYMGAVQKTINISSTPTYFDLELTPTSTAYLIIYRGGSGDAGTYFIDDVTVKEVLRDAVPRIDYTGGGCPHILAEPQRTNLITYSEDFSQSSWSKSAGGTGVIPIVTSNYGVSPNGTQNADRIQFELNGGTSGTDTSYISDFYTATGVASTNSIYLKSLSTTKNIRLRCGGTFKSVDVTGDWQRFDITDTSSSDRFQLLLYGNLNSQNADLLVWGGQAEAGSYATSYIPTDGGTVTRNQDIFTRDGIGSLINSTEGVLFWEGSGFINGGSERMLTLSDGTTSNVIQSILHSTASRIIFRLILGGVNTVNLSSFDISQTVNLKIALKWKENDFALWINGVEKASLTSGSTFSTNTINELNFADNNGVSNALFGKVKQLQVYKTALTDVQLAALTS